MALISKLNLYSTVAGNDFVPPMMLNIVFPVFETEEGDTECASISIIDDMELEGDRQDFTIHIGDIDPPNVMNDGMVYATIRIQDDDEDGKYLAHLLSTIAYSVSTPTVRALLQSL